MIEKHCIVPTCNTWPCWGNGNATACGEHKHIIGFGAQPDLARPAEQRPGEGRGSQLIAAPRARPSDSAQGRLL